MSRPRGDAVCFCAPSLETCILTVLTLVLAASSAMWISRGGDIPIAAAAALPGAPVTSEADLRALAGAWLAPKARLPQRCEACQCEFESSTGENDEGGSPAIDAATAEVSDQISALSAGSHGLSLTLHYNSDLADGSNTILATTLGNGWTHSHNSYLLERQGNLYWIRGSNEIVCFKRQGDGYITSTGQFMQLELLDPDNAQVTLKDGTTCAFSRRTVMWHPGGDVFAMDACVDPNGRATTYSYNSEGLPASATEYFGNSITLEYDGGGKLSRAAASDRMVTFEYDAPTGQLSAVELAGGGRIEYDYNFIGQMTQKTLPNGDSYLVGYNGHYKAHRLTDGAGTVYLEQSSSTDWAVDHQRSLATGEMHYFPGTVTITDGRGNEWVYAHDERGLLTSLSDPNGCITTNEYDSATLMPSRVEDGNGNAVEYEYDSMGNRILMRDCEGNETVYMHEPVHNNMILMIEPDGDEWHYDYDAFGNLIEVVDPLIEAPLDATLTYEYYDSAPHEGLLHRAYDRNGNVTEWTYDAEGNVASVVDPTGAVVSYDYDAFGNVLSHTVHNDSGDQVTSYIYDERDRVVSTTDPLGHTTRYEYDESGNRTTMFECWLDESNYRSQAEYAYDHRGRLISIVEDSGGINRTTQYEYDANDNRIKSIDPSGVATEHHYDPANRVERSVVDAGGLALETVYEYDCADNLTGVRDPNGHVTSYEYDCLHRRVRATDALGGTTDYIYFPPGGGGGGCSCGTPGSSLPKCIIDAEGKITQYEYDALDRTISETRQIGVQDCDRGPIDGVDATISYDYDPNGNQLSVHDPNGNTVSYTYSARDEVESMTNGSGETTAHEYDAAGNRVIQIPPHGNVIVYEYDLQNRLTGVSDSLGDVVSYSYDCADNRTSETNALGHTTTTVYDNLDRPLTVIDALGSTTMYEYDAVDNLLSMTDREGNVTEYDYDGAHRRIEMRMWPDADDLGAPAVATYEYDAVGNVTRIVDAEGRATEYEYDALDRVVIEAFADGTERRFTYDAASNMIAREDNMGEDDSPGNVTAYTFDDLHRLVQRDYATGHTDTLTYDLGGRVLSAENDFSRIEYQYDAANRIMQSTQSSSYVGWTTYSHTVSYVHDGVANTRTITYPSGKVVVETRDLRGRLGTVTQDAALLADYEYDLAGRVTRKNFGNGTHAEMSYNDNNWMTELRHIGTDGVTTFAGFGYSYDLEGNRLTAENLQAAIAYADGKPVTHSEVYEYDDIYRLIDYRRGEWASGDVPAPRRQREWVLDNVHNWTKFSVHDLETGENADYCNSVNQMNEYDDASTDGMCPIPDDDGLADDFMVSPCEPIPQLLLVAGAQNVQLPPQPLPVTGLNRAHDKNGNLVSDGGRQYYYDYQTNAASCPRAANLLTMVEESAGGTVLGEYWYDTAGRRIRKEAGGVTTVYVYSYDWRVIAEYEDGALARDLVYGDGIDDILSLERASDGSRYFYHPNALGSILALTDSLGTSAERYSYDAYGAAQLFDGAGAAISASALENPYLFCGRRLDFEIALYQNRARYYDPVAGRFLTRDPLGSWWDRFNGGGAYTYVGGNPLSRVDPLGLETFEVENQLSGSEKTNYLGTYWTYNWKSTGKGLVSFDLTVTDKKVSVFKIDDNSNNTEAFVVISRYHVPHTWVWHTTGTISHAANGWAKKVCCDEKKDTWGVIVNAKFVATAGKLAVKEGGNAGGKGEVKGIEISGGSSWEAGRENQGFTVQPSAKYKLCPDGKGGYTVKLISTHGEGIGDKEDAWYYFHKVDGVNWFASKLTHRKK